MMLDQELSLSRPQVRVSNFAPEQRTSTRNLTKKFGGTRSLVEISERTVGGGKPIVIHHVPDGTTKNLASKTTMQLRSLLVLRGLNEIIEHNFTIKWR